MKAWIKEKKSIRAVLEAGPFEFLEAFGMPGYRTLSLKKEMKFLVTSHIHPASK